MFRVFYYKTLNNHLDKKKRDISTPPQKKRRFLRVNVPALYSSIISLKSNDDFDDPERERERERDS